MRQGKYDIPALLAQVSLITVLLEHGVEPPTGRLRGACPLHNGQNPNFSIFADGKRWRCWSRCGGGDAIDLVMRLQGCSWADAVRWLVRVAGGDVPKLSSATAERRRTVARRRAALREWQERRLGTATDNARELERRAEAAGQVLHREGSDAPEHVWAAFGEAVRDAERAELEFETLFTVSNVDEIAVDWLAENEHEDAA